MSRVEIDAGGRKVVVEHEGELAHLAKTATELWDHTDGATAPSPGPAVGFVAGQRYEPPPVSGGGYTGRARPRVTGSTEEEGSTGG